jgi:hypothetical protein
MEKFTDQEQEAAKQTWEACEAAKPFLHEALELFCKHMANNTEGFVAYGMTGFKLALFEAAVHLQIIMEYGGMVDRQPEKLAEMMFAESARVAFKKIIAQHGGLAAMRRHVKQAHRIIERMDTSNTERPK